MRKYFELKLVNSKDCFLHVSHGNVASMQSKIFNIYDGSGKDFFGLSSCFATPSQNLKDNEVGISPKFAAVLGIKDFHMVHLEEIQSAATATSQVIFTASDSDYSILIMNAAKVEYILLDQVRVIGLGQKIIVWMSPRLSITLTAEKLTPAADIGLLSNETELHILPISDVAAAPLSSSSAVPVGSEAGKQTAFRVIFSPHTHDTPQVAKIHPDTKLKFLFASAKIIGSEKLAKLQIIEDPSVGPAFDVLSGLPVIYIDRRAFLPSKGVFEGCKVLLQPLEVVRINEFIIHASDECLIEDIKLFLKQIADRLRKELLITNQMIIYKLNKGSLRFELRDPYTILSSAGIENCNISILKDLEKPELPKSHQAAEPKEHTEIFSSWVSLLNDMKLSLVTNMKTDARLPVAILSGKSGSGIDKFLQEFIRTMTTSLKMHDLALDCKSFKGKTIDILKNKLSDLFLEGAKHDPCIIVFENVDQFNPALSTEPNESPESSYRQAVLQIIWNLSHSFSSQHDCFVVVTMSADQDFKVWNDKTIPFEVFQVPDLSSMDKVQALKQSLESLNCCWTEELDTNSAQIVEICTYQDICDIALRAVFEKLKSRSDLGKISITKDDLLNARNYLTSQNLKDFNSLTVSDPSVKDRPTDCWSKVGGLLKVKETLTEMIFWPFTFSHLFASNPLKLQKGALLYGMPGTGKTLLAVELAKSSGMNLIHIKGPELLNKFIGASEEAVRNLFHKASAAKPCILFFDEIDSLAPRRGRDTTGVSDRVVNQLLTSLDGVDSPAEAGVWVLAASSRPDLIDRALLRPGRFDTMLHCNLPVQEERDQIIQILSKNLQLSGDVDLNKLALETDGFCGADIQALLQTAQLNALEEFIDVYAEETSTASMEDVNLEICWSHITKALATTRPSLSTDDKKRYGKIYADYERSLKPIGRGKRKQLKQVSVLA